jgi:hypothetical protein
MRTQTLFPAWNSLRFDSTSRKNRQPLSHQTPWWPHPVCRGLFRFERRLVVRVRQSAWHDIPRSARPFKRGGAGRGQHSGLSGTGSDSIISLRTFAKELWTRVTVRELNNVIGWEIIRGNCEAPVFVYYCTAPSFCYQRLCHFKQLVTDQKKKWGEMNTQSGEADPEFKLRIWLGTKLRSVGMKNATKYFWSQTFIASRLEHKPGFLRRVTSAEILGQIKARSILRMVEEELGRNEEVGKNKDASRWQCLNCQLWLLIRAATSRTFLFHGTRSYFLISHFSGSEKVRQF